jgi:hypothetical protein
LDVTVDANPSPVTTAAAPPPHVTVYTPGFVTTFSSISTTVVPPTPLSSSPHPESDSPLTLETRTCDEEERKMKVGWAATDRA